MSLIYILEDDPGIQEIESIALKNCNYNVQAFDRASSFYAQLDSLLPDLILLDIMLPDEDGYRILRKLRQDSRTRQIPIIMVTAKTTETDMLRGLDGGADDYIRKPFSVMELISRVRALLRRSREQAQTQVSVGNVMVDFERHLVKVDGENVVLTLKEFELLKYLMLNEGIVLSRESIMQAVWGTDFEGESRTVDMHIKTLRQKLGSGGSLIHTIRGVGYSVK